MRTLQAQDEIDAFLAEATSGDYDHLLQATRVGSTGTKLGGGLAVNGLHVDGG
jgi:hypothetical protein